MTDINRVAKERVRAIIRDRRSNLAPEIQAGCADTLSSYLNEFVSDELSLPLKEITMAAYMPCRGEISAVPFLKDVIKNNGKVLLPRVSGDDLVFCEVSDLDKELEEGTYGIKEPVEGLNEVDISKADVIIVPAIAYNDEGARLGQGGGFYDRLWQKLGGDSPDRKNVLIGICYDFQIISSIPVDESDMVVDVLFQVETEGEEEQ